MKIKTALLILVVGGCFYLAYDSFFQKKEPVRVPGSPVAMKLVTRGAAGAPYDCAVDLVDGAQWRVESSFHQASQPVVAVSDGGHAVSSLPGSAAALDPRPFLNYFLAAADSYTALVQTGKAPNTTVLGDRRHCWKTGMTYQGHDVQFWVDSKTHYPVCVASSTNGKFIECHFVPLQVDFAGRSAELFDTSHLAPLFAGDLKP